MLERFRENRRLVRELGRIADALEMLISLQYGYEMQAPKAAEGGAPPEVLYTDEEKIELMERLEKVSPDDEERRGQLRALQQALREGKYPEE